MTTAHKIATTPGVCPYCENGTPGDRGHAEGACGDYFDNVDDELTYCYGCGNHATNPDWNGATP